MAAMVATTAELPVVDAPSEPKVETINSGKGGMLHSRVHIEAGDLVIVFMNRENMLAITATPGEVFHNKFGRYSHDSIIGMKFGSKIHSAPPHSGYVNLLRPTPELWTLSLPHRTQILYLPDIAYITMRLAVRVGGQVAEAGTGSGSMTHSLSRTVGPRGKVLSYEFNQPRYEKAKVEFDGHGLSNVDLSHRNVCKDGFGDVEGVEAVFLDLPAPWEAIPHAVKILRPDIITRICCFSPCLEQVLKTVQTLRTEGFTDISTQEVLVRTHELVQPSTNQSYMSNISDLVTKLKQQAEKKEERRLVQMRTAREKSRKEKPAEEADPPAKKQKVDENKPQSRRRDPEAELEALQSYTHPSRPKLDWQEPTPMPSTTILTRPTAEMRGHTSYLTFAHFPPASIRQQLAAQDTKSRLGKLKTAAVADAPTPTATDYDSDGMDEVMGTLTEEQMMGLSGTA